MMRNYLLFVLFVTLFAQSVFSQNYWQQNISYTIKVSLDDKNHELNAQESIDYTNNSPDELSEIYMHLWPNAYKDQSTALNKQKLENGSDNLHYAAKENRGYIEGLFFKVDGKVVIWEWDAEHIDIGKITLNEPLKSGGKITITTPFKVKIPLGVYSRLGHIGESYQITQWYPKPAVYDANGWHKMPYLDQGEFYSEYGTFDVYITLPENYVVGATGDLVNGARELEWLDKKVQETKTYIKGIEDKIQINIPGQKRLKESQGDEELNGLEFPESSAKLKTLHYRQSQVHDFGWFADKRWHVLKGEVKLPHSNNLVTTWVMFTDAEANLWQGAIEYMNDAIYYYSLWNGDYPYKQATAVDGALSAGGGMEYPNVTVIGRSGSKFGLETVIMHEVGHNWFYGILGSNERDHPWMDEGLNSFNENRYIETKYPNRKLIGSQGGTKMSKLFDLDRYLHKDSYYQGYLLNARRNLDQAIENHSNDYTMINYGTIVYGKTALVFDYLMAYLGNDVMDKAMHAYFDEWKFKHPQPNDLRKVLEQETGKNLSWFFDNMINSTNKVDYKIRKVKEVDGKLNVQVKNKTGTAVPFSIAGMKDGKPGDVIWFDGFQKKQQVIINAGDFEAIRIDPTLDIPEINRRNNTWKTKGLFKKVEPLKLQFLGSLENPDRSQLYFMPIAGWNNYDRWMLGSAFYNSLVPARRFDFVIAPMFSVTSKTLLGSGNLGYNIYPKGNILQNVRISIGGSRYSNGQKVETFHVTSPGEGVLSLVRANKVKSEMEFTFKNANPRSKASNVLSITNYQLIFTRQETGLSLNQVLDSAALFLETDKYYINRLAWDHVNSRIINPYSMNLSFEQGDYFVKGSFTGNYRLSYKRGRGLDIRLFSGRFLFNEISKMDPKYGFSMDGNSDYLYDAVFLGRAETSGVLSGQFVENDGGFKNEVNKDSLANAQTWLTALNVQTPIIRKLPVLLYADIGWTSSAPEDIIYGGGAALELFGNILKVYFPFYVSTELPHTQYEKNIRFVFNVAALNPFELLRKIPN